MPPSWVTLRWVEAQEAKAREAAERARASARRRIPGGWLERLQRALPGHSLSSVLPLFVCVGLAVALFAAVLPLCDGSAR